MYRWLCIVFAGLLMSACTHYISEESLRLASQTIPYGAVQRNPDGYVGSYLLVGGKIASVTNDKEGGEIEVVQLRVDSSGRPQGDIRNSEGRFMARTSYFVDPLIYKNGMLVSMVGQVKGKEVKPLDAATYTYPVLAVRELHLWHSDELYRGYGPYPPYSPYYYPYDYPYSYGLCDFGYGPSPYMFGWDQNWCYYDGYSTFPYDTDDLGRGRHERSEGRERSERRESAPPASAESARPRESAPPISVEPERGRAIGPSRGGESEGGGFFGGHGGGEHGGGYGGGGHSGGGHSGGGHGGGRER